MGGKRPGLQQLIRHTRKAKREKDDMSNRAHVRLHSGIPEGESSMPTCGACRTQLTRGEVYASVPQGKGSREVRHNTEDCLRWQIGTGADLAVGSVVTTHRYALTEWGGRIDGVITELTEEQNEFGWRGYMIAPADPSDTSEIESFRTHPEEFFRRMADTLVIDPSPRLVFISDGELIHHIPSA